MRLYNTADNADITQSQAANHYLPIESRDTSRRMHKVNSLCTDSRALRAEYCIVGSSHNTASL